MRCLSLKIGLALALIVGLGCARAAHAKDEAKLNPPIEKGLRVFTAGHSFHVFVSPILNGLAKDAGIENHMVAGLSRIGGSRVIQHWDVVDDKNDAKRMLKAGEVDVLTLSPIWFPDEGIEKFVRLGAKHNPELRITVQEYWLPNDEYVPVYPLQTKKKVDHNATKLADLKAAQAKYDADLSAIVTKLNQEFGRRAVLLVPVGQAAIGLREKIAAGEAPGLKTQEELFRDSWGHATTPLQLLSAYCHFAVIYRKSPVGLPVPLPLRNYAGVKEPEKAALNRLLQELAWDAVVSHPLAGVAK